MRKKSIAIIVPALFAAAVLVSTNASAYHKVSIGGPVSRGQLLKDCNAVGGLCGNCKGQSGGYSCTNPNNPGGETVVQCTSGGKCTGYIPRKGNPPHTIGGILHPPSGGVKSSGGNQPPNGHPHPVKVRSFRPPSGVKTTGGNSGPPAPIMRTAGHHSGGGHR